MILGTESSIGVTEFFQLSTNVLSDLNRIYNVSGKLLVHQNKNFAVAATIGYQTYNYQDVNILAPNAQSTSWMPGLVIAIEPVTDWAIFLGGNYQYSVLGNAIATETAGYLHGANAEVDLTWAYRGSERGIPAALSLGASYDFTYSLVGVGLSHHWPSFHLGAHYYPSATFYRFQPILAGSMTVDF